MPVSSFSGLNLALRALTAQQRALDVTAHNIANADRAGYTRQEAVLAAAASLDIANGSVSAGGGLLLGQGVDVADLRRIRDSFLDLQVRAQAMALGQEQSTTRALTQVEGILQEPGDSGLNALLGKFWSAWQDLANTPESNAAKAAVVGAARNVADAFNRLDSQLSAIGAAATAEAGALTGAGGEVDRIARELGTLDSAIAQALSGGRSPNDLLDRRDQLLDQLSALGQVSVTELGGGSIAVQFGDAAQPLTNGATVTWPQALTAPGGRIGGLLAIANTTIPAYRADLDAVAGQLASAVNGIHPTAVFSGATAGTLTTVATTATIDAGTGTAPGANDIALALTALRGGAADTSYADLVARIGNDAAGARAGEATARAVGEQLAERRAEVAGVSLDEEMANMLRFQRGYQAAARAMTTMDEALDTLINRTGRVGL